MSFFQGHSRIKKAVKSLWRFLQRPELLFYLLLYFMGLLIIGTVAQKSMGMFPAIHHFFNSFVFWYGPLPFPGGASVLAVLFVHLLVHFIAKTRWERHYIGHALAHLSILVLLLGGGITLFHKQEGFLLLRLNETTADVYDYDEGNLLRPDIQPQFTLPFSLTLQDFKQAYYPGTDIAQAYKSDLMIGEGQQHWPALIAMNEPLRYKGYTFYQSSVLTLPNGEIASVLSVVDNPGWVFPYVATALLFVGLLIHAGVRRHEHA